MRSLLIVLVASASLGSVHDAADARPTQPQEERPRLIVLTDIGNEPDDAESMVRLLLYSNEIDIEGLVAATSRHLPNRTHADMIEQRVAAYGKVLANLRRHDAAYPDEKKLRSRIRSGSPVYGMAGVGAGKDTDASRLIIAAVDKSDTRPVWIAIWGGAADLAQALWTVRATRSADEVARFVSKLRVYSISDQDDAGPWARAYFPHLFWATSVHGFTQYMLGTWRGISAVEPGSDPTQVSRAWLSAHVAGKGPLGALYPLPIFIMEGDTPSFLNLIANGLSVPERPDWGGWGGRYDKVSDGLGLWASTIDSVRGVDAKVHATPQATVWRWRAGFQNDFAARMDWTIAPDIKRANHPPELMLNGTGGAAPLALNGCPSQPIALTAAGSIDPDGDSLTYRWFQYREASGVFAPQAKLSASDTASTSVTISEKVYTDPLVPPAHYEIHVILEVSDGGTPSLTRYRRAVITVPTAGSAAATETCQIKPVQPVH